MGTDGTLLDDRVARYSDDFGLVSESFVFSDEMSGMKGQGLEMAKFMLVDDGVQAKGHQTNMLDT